MTQLKLTGGFDEGDRGIGEEWPQGGEQPELKLVGRPKKTAQKTDGAQQAKNPVNRFLKFTADILAEAWEDFAFRARRVYRAIAAFVKTAVLPLSLIAVGGMFGGTLGAKFCRGYIKPAPKIARADVENNAPYEVPTMRALPDSPAMPSAPEPYFENNTEMSCAIAGGVIGGAGLPMGVSLAGTCLAVALVRSQRGRSGRAV